MSQEVSQQKDHFPPSSTLKVTLLAGEWTSSAGGLSTLNRELAIHLSQHPKVDVSFLVPEGACKDEDKREAQSYGITVVDAKKRLGFDRLDWLSVPPQDLRMDVVVGHGGKLGRQVQFVRDAPQYHNIKWVQVAHTAPEDLSRYKSYSDPISKGESKHQIEVDLCKLADLVVPIGPRLEEAYSSYLRRCKTDQDVFVVTPGLFDREFGDLEQSPNENAEFKVLLCGRGDDEDFELKGYNIAVEAFTDHRLKAKPYHLFFVGAPDGKQEEVRRKLLLSGIAEEQLTVRKFVQSRDRMKDLLNEVDLAIMPSKSEGFGLVSLEALSAGLPILVGKKSGFAKALESIPFGKSCIVDSDDPTKWAEAIEDVCVRHRVRLEEIKSVRESYNKTYSWKEQCEALVEKMWSMVQVASPVELQAAADKPHAPSKQQPPPCEEEKASGTNEDTLSLTKEYVQVCIKESISGSTHDLGALIRLVITTQDLNDEQQEIVNEILTRQVQVYVKHHNLSTAEGVGALIEYIIKAYNLALESVYMGSLELILQCPTIENLEHLWSDHLSGRLNKVAERYLATDEIKRKLKLETVKFKTTIQEENYLTCKKALVEMTGKQLEFASYLQKMMSSLNNTIQHLRTAANYPDKVWKITKTVNSVGLGVLTGGTMAAAGGIVTALTGGAAAPFLMAGAGLATTGIATTATAQKVNSAIQSNEVKKADDNVEYTKRVLNDVRERIPDVQDQVEFLVGQIVMELGNIQKAINELLEETFTVESQGGVIVFNVIQVIKDRGSKAAQCFRDKAKEIEVVLQRYLSSV